jgi:predicted SnoaL-like aldol condensation-catalyzing enzyme
MNKNYLPLLLVPFLALLTSCQVNRQKQMDKEHMDAYVQVNKLIDAGDTEGLDAYMSPNIIDHQTDASGMYKKGLEGVKEMISDIHKSMPDMKTTINTMAVSGDTLFGFITSTGTTAEPFMGISANQMQTINMVDIVRFEGNKIAEHWGFIDVADVIKMMPQDTTSMMQ